MSYETNQFYEQIEGFSDFSEFSNAKWYHPLPEDWCVVITDVTDSTKAIEEGRYKQVNGVGVASIVALTNAVKPLTVPYVFGGDGATACFPSALLDKVRPALAATRKMAFEHFGLELRIGTLHMSQIRRKGFDVLVGKLKPHLYYQQAMFLGGGLGYAEKCIKDPDPDNPYLFKREETSPTNIFDGFECRWDEIQSPCEENIALLVQALDSSDSRNDKTYALVLDQINLIYGGVSQHHPLKEKNLTLAGSTRLLSVEAGVRTAFQPIWYRVKYLIRLHILRWIGLWFMKRGTQTDATNWGEYKKNLIVNTDFRKFDELLRMVISGSKKQRARLRSFLEKMQAKGKIAFGLHSAPSSLITCIVTNYDKDHVHFLDGANGGYAMAATELKHQLRLKNENDVR